MKLRLITLTPDQLVLLLQGKGNSLNLPADAELLDVKVDLFTYKVSIVIRSGSFEDVAVSTEIPELQTSAQSVVSSEVKPVAPAPVQAPVSVAEPKVEPKPVAPPVPVEVKPLVPRPTQPPLSRYAAKMENEFSPDQRKLLSFSLKDNSVVVKPVTFLKTEWDDINDVVRGLGGRWVKGDIISYWEIPLQ